VRSHAKASSVGSVWIAAAFALALSFAFLLISVAPASAAVGHSVLRTFSTGPNTDPRAIATDSTGNVYVVEVGASRIDKFAASGSRASFSGSASYIGESSLTGTSLGPLDIANWNDVGIAVDRTGAQSDGTIYVAFADNTPGGNLLRFDPTGVFRARAYQQFDYYCGAAIDQTTGAVYRTNQGVAVRFPTPSSGFTSDGTLNVGGCAIAADSAGAVYMGSSPVRKFDASQFGAASPVSSAELPVAASALAVDPDSGDVLANDGGRIVVFDAAGAQQGAAFGDLSNSRGVTTDPDGNVLATDSAGGVFVYGPNEVQLPIATTGGSNNVTTDSAEVEGSVDPDGAGNITACEIRFGEDSGYADGSAPCTPGGPISSPSAVNATLTGLVSGTTYHYRVFVTNANGTQMASSEQTFTTLNAIEGVTAEGATAVQKDSATLTGSYTGDGQEAHYFFEWGATTAYGHTTPVPPGAVAGNGSGTQNVAPVQISGLRGSTIYHYRLVVSDPDGISRSQDASFTTPAAVSNLTADVPTAATETSADLRASFDGDGTYATSYYFEWGPTPSYGNVAPVPPGNTVPAGNGRIDVPPVTIAGLEGGSTYHFRVVASNAAGTSTSADTVFKTAEAPVIGNVGSRDVTAVAAELVAEINPRYGQTSYQFEWGPTATYGNSTPVPAGDAGSAGANVPVSAPVEGLTPGVTYHFRLVATNQYGTTPSPDQTFGFYPPACPNAQLRQETRSNDLPDCRAYELVTPNFAQGALIVPSTGPNTGLATSPARLSYSTTFGTFPESSGEPTNLGADLFVSTRTDSGWAQRYIGLPGSKTLYMGGPPKTAQVLPQLTWGPTDYQLGTQASPQMDRIIDYDQGWPYGGTPGGSQRGNPSNAPYVWNSTTGSLLGRWPSNLSSVSGGEDFAGIPQASTDFSHFVFNSNVVFAANGEASEQKILCCSGLPGPPPASSVYDNDLGAGTVALASVKKDGTPFKGHVWDVSDDGTHILMAEEAVWPPKSGFPEIAGPLYLRVSDAPATTYEIAPGRHISYIGSTAAGSTVYLTSSEQLTPDDTDSSRDLYVWRQSEPNSLTRVSAGSGGAGNSDSCTPTGGWTTKCDVGIAGGFWIEEGPPTTFSNGAKPPTENDNFIAAKTGDIYFVSPELLAGAKGEADEVNLYLFRAGTVRFVGTLNPGSCNCAKGALSRMQVTPDGSHMALVTPAHLTGYDSGAHAEMYTYDPQGGRTRCVSCRPDGLPPVSDVEGSLNGLYLTNDGRVFFSTKDPLVPRDTNEGEDVYEYAEGKAQLISTGTGTEPEVILGIGFTEPGLVSVSANGTDVYFSTYSNLVTQDHNGGDIKIYDARTGGGFPAEIAEPNCAAADECHGPSSNAPTLPPDRTSANLGAPRNAKAHKAKKKHHKAKKHKARKHKKKRAGKPTRKTDNAKQGGKHHG
jgi:hypothetical protein